MFKKDEIIISQQNIMSNKERKEFISVYLKKLFDSSLIETHLFESKWQSQKIAGSKKRIIFYEENPIFFEYDKDIYFPTVYLLNRIPMIIKYDCLIYPDTDDYLKNGADLMVKGILNRKIFPTSFQLGTCFKVITLNGEITSIGVSLVSSSLLSTLNEKGKFLTIVHRKDDFLFKLGTEKYSSTWTDGKLNAFSIAQTCGLIKPVEQLESIKQVEKSNLEYLFDQNASELANKTKESIFTEKIASNDSKFINNEISSKFDINFINSDPTEISSNLLSNKDEENFSKLNPEEIDINLFQVFYTIFKYSKNLEEDLPIDPGKFLQNYMKPIANDFNKDINLKQSTFKGMNNFLKFIAKEHKTLVFSKIGGQDKLSSLIKDPSQHKVNIEEFFLIKTLKKVLSCDIIKEKIHEKDNIILEKGEHIEVKCYYKPLNMFVGFFAKAFPEFIKGESYELKFIIEIVLAYLKKENLLDKGEVIINEELAQVFRLKTDKSNLSEEKSIKNYPERIEISAFNKYIKEQLSEKDSVVKVGENGEEILSQNSKIKITITAKKLNNKNITLIDGLEEMFSLKEISSLLAKNFACSVAVKSFTANHESILLQGYWVHELIDLFEKELKINKKFITIDDRLKLKKKK